MFTFIPNQQQFHLKCLTNFESNDAHKREQNINVQILRENMNLE